VFDADGRFAPVFDEAKTSLETEQVILAVGQTADIGFCRDFGVAGDGTDLAAEDGWIAADPQNHETAIRGVFAGGDGVSGPGTIVGAIAAGRRAAASIDRYLGGDGIISAPSTKRAAALSYDGRREPGFAERKRVEPPSIDVSERRKGFAEVELCQSDHQAVCEANRCLQCDLEYCLVMEARGG
jgi:NADH-quinone oxidoreductase subunit F